MRVDYHHPARGDLKVVGTVIKTGRLVSVAEAKVYDAEDRLVASGRGVYATPRRPDPSWRLRRTRHRAATLGR